MNELPDDDCFGNGFRFRVFRGAGIDAAVSSTLPMAIVGWIALHFVGVLDDDGAAWALSGLWLMGLALQVIAAFVVIRLAGRPVVDGGPVVERGPVVNLPVAVTLTVGGVWLAPGDPNPDSVPRLPGEWNENGERPGRPATPSPGLVVVVWTAVLASILFAAAWASWQSDAGMPAGWVLPSVGWSTWDQPLAAAAWLWMLQAVWQALPIPQSLGRVGWTLLVSGLVRRSDDGLERGIRQSRRLIRWFAMVTLLITMIWWLPPLANRLAWTQTPPILAMLVLSVWLVASIGSHDIPSVVQRASKFGHLGCWRDRVHPGEIRQRRRRQREALARHKALVAVRDREHREADDAARAEQVLQKLHDSGVDSLLDDERELLQRVSRAVRLRRIDGARVDDAPR